MDERQLIGPVEGQDVQRLGGRGWRFASLRVVLLRHYRVLTRHSFGADEKYPLQGRLMPRLYAISVHIPHILILTSLSSSSLTMPSAVDQYVSTVALLGTNVQSVEAPPHNHSGADIRPGPDTVTST